MRVFRSPFLLSVLFLAACSAPEQIAMRDHEQISDNFLEMGEAAAAGEKPLDLFVDPTRVTTERNRFIEELKKIGSGHADTRKFYESYIDDIGANGVLDGIETLWPKCHGEAHDLGKIIYAKTQDMALGLKICADGCYSGCMHGVLMEAFSTAQNPDDPSGHVDIEIVKTMMKDLCFENDTMTSSYSQGDCAHGVGHAMMVLAEYEIADAMDLCDAFGSDPMNYYCATGAYMEYVNTNDAADTAAGKRALYPCDVGRYPAACARYKMVHVIGRLVKQPSDVQKLMRSCNQLENPFRLGCYHGAGNGFMSMILKKKATLSDVCGTGTDEERYVCIEGAMERMAKYHPERAEEVCSGLTRGSKDRETCDKAVEQGMYDMEKDFTLYIGG